MQKITRFTADEREDLTAYLDGELDDARSQQIEQKLARSDVARREVDLLSRTWDMLNLLPRVDVSAEFSQKTVSIARRSDQLPFAGQTDKWAIFGKRAGLLSGWFVLLVIAGMIGYQVTNRWIPDESRYLVEELPIIENLDNYREVGDIEFLQQLRSSRVFQGTDHASE